MGTVKNAVPSGSVAPAGKPAARARARPVTGDRPVFAAERRRRHRAVNVGLGLVGILVLCWLVALVAGALGLGNLPAIPFTGGKDAAPPTVPRATQAAAGPKARPFRSPGSASPYHRSAQPAAAATKQAPAKDPGRKSASVGDVSPGGAAAPGQGAGGHGATAAPRRAGSGRPPGQAAAPTTPGKARATPATGGGRLHRGAPAVTPSGREVPSASGSSDEAGAARETEHSSAPGGAADKPG